MSWILLIICGEKNYNRYLVLTYFLNKDIQQEYDQNYC